MGSNTADFMLSLQLDEKQKKKFRKDLDIVLKYTETSNDRSEFYKFNFAGKGNSACSIGPYQIDLGSSNEAAERVADLLKRNFGFSDTEIATLKTKQVNPGTAFLNIENEKLSQALSGKNGEQNRAALDQIFSNYLDGKIEKLQKLIDLVSVVKPDFAKQIYASEELQLRLMDYDNQFNIDLTPNKKDALMLRFLRGESVTMHDGVKVEVGSTLEVSDIEEYLKHTKQYTEVSGGKKEQIDRAGRLRTGLAAVDLSSPSVDLGNGPLSKILSAVDQKLWYQFDPAQVIKQALSALTGAVEYRDGVFKTTDKSGATISFMEDGSQTATWKDVAGTRGAFTYSVPSKNLYAEWSSNLPGLNKEVSGSIIGTPTKTEVSLTYFEGTTVTHWFNKDGSGGVSNYNATDKTRSTEEFRADGSTLEIDYFQNGSISKIYEQKSDGTVNYKNYLSTGVLVEEGFDGTNISRRTNKYYDSGKLKITELLSKDGSGQSAEYYENGKIKALSVLNVDGSSRYEDRSEDGSRIKISQLDTLGNRTTTITIPGQSSTETVFVGVPKALEPNDPNLSTVYTSQDGTVFTKTYDLMHKLLTDEIRFPDGSWHMEKHFANVGWYASVEDRNADGTGSLKTYYANTGIASESYTKADGSYNYKNYDALGYLVSSRWQLSNGTNGEDTYKPSGESFGSSKNVDGSKSKYTVNKDGIKSTSISYLDGTYAEVDENAFGVVEKSLFDENGELLLSDANPTSLIFCAGGGKSTLINGDTSALRFGKGIAYASLNLQEQGRDLLVSYSPTDSVLIENYGSGAYPTFAFIDGSSVFYFKNDDGLLTAVFHDTLGHDVYTLGFGTGHTTIQAGSTGGNSLIRFLDSVSPTDVALRRNANNGLVVALADGRDSLTIENWYDNSSNPIQEAIFSNGDSWSLPTLVRNLPVIGTAGDDWLRGGYGDDVLEGLAGDDVLAGQAGNDIYVFGFGSGHDTVYDYDSDTANAIHLTAGVGASDVSLSRDAENNLVISLTGGADTLTLLNDLRGKESPIQKVVFADGLVWDLVEKAHSIPLHINGSSDSDVLIGSAGVDIFNGSAGDDHLYGGLGDDIYIFGFGSGHDTIWDTNATNLIQLTEGVSRSDISLSRDGSNNLVITLPGGNDSITLSEWYSFTGKQTGSLQFSDGTLLDLTEIASLEIMGTGGDDYMVGGVEDDILDGKEGNDFLNGSVGNDSYVFGWGSGHDTINDLSGENYAYFSRSVSESDVTIRRSNEGDLVLSLGAGADTLTLRRWYWNPSYQTVKVAFADGVIWDLQKMAARLPADGTPGNDRIQGGMSSDVLDGASGNDVLLGSGGDDIYLFGFGSGKDIVQESVGYDSNEHLIASGADLIQLKAGVKESDVFLLRDGYGNLIVSLAGGGDSLKLSNWFGDSDARVEKIAFSQGETWILDRISEDIAPNTSITLEKTSSGTLIARYYLADSTQIDKREYSVDGSWVREDFSSSGEPIGYSVYSVDLSGKKIVARYETGHTQLSEEWVSPDGSYGEISYSKNGSSNGINHNADGSYSEFSRDSSGSVETGHFDANGIRTGSSRYVGGLDGVGTTTHYDSIGGVLSQEESEILASGNHILKQYNAEGKLLLEKIIASNGSIESRTFNTDESYTVKLEDVNGNFSESKFDASGFLFEKFWGESDGSSGHDQYLDDGSSSGEAYDRFGIRSRSYVNNGLGTISTIYWSSTGFPDHSSVFVGDESGRGTLTSYNNQGISTGYETIDVDWFQTKYVSKHSASGKVISEGWSYADGSSELKTYTLNGGYTLLVDDGAGLKTTTSFDLDGKRYLTSWIKGDGSWGEDIFNQDGTVKRAIFDGNGSQVSLHQKDGSVTTQSFDIYNRLTRVEQISSTGSVRTDVLDPLSKLVISSTFSSISKDSVVTGGEGRNIYVIDPGVGTVHIKDSTRAGTILFGQGITADQISLGLGSLLIRIGNTGDAIHIDGVDPNNVEETSGVTSFKFANGTTLTLHELVSRGFDIFDTNGDDALQGTNLADRIFSSAGTDTIDAGAGDDVLSVSGSKATFIIESGDGVDTINNRNRAAISFGADVIQFGSEIQADDLILAIGQSSAITLALRGYNNVIKVTDDAFLGELRFSDGSHIKYEHGVDSGPTLSAFDSTGTLISTTTYLLDGASTIGVTKDVTGTLISQVKIVSIGANEFDVSAFDASHHLIEREIRLAGGETIALGTSPNTQLNWIHFKDGSQALQVSGTDIEDRLIFLNQKHHVLNDYSLNFPDSDSGQNQVHIDPVSGEVTSTEVYPSSGGHSLLNDSSGDDTYHLKLGDGVNVINGNTSPDDESEDGVMLGSGITLDSVDLQVAGSNVYVKYSADDVLIIKGLNVTDGLSPMRLPYIAFADNQYWEIDFAQSSSLYAQPVAVITVGDYGQHKFETLWFAPDGAHGVEVETFNENLERISYSRNFYDSNGSYNIYQSSSDGRYTSESYYVNGDSDGDLRFINAVYASESGDDLGTLEFREYDIDHQLLGYGQVERQLDTDGGISFVAMNVYDRNNTLVKRDWTDVVANTQGSDEYFENGSSRKKVTNMVDQSYSVTEDDGHGNVHRVVYAEGGNVISDVWEHVNHAPTIQEDLVSQTIKASTTISYTLPQTAFADSDAGDSLSYSIKQADGTALPAWLVFDAATRTLSGTPTSGDVGNLTLKVVATDGGGLSASQTFSFSVTNANEAPVVRDAIGAQATDQGAVFSYVVPASAFSDIDAGDSLSHSIKLSNGSALPSWLSFDSATRTLSGTPANGDVGNLSLKVVATDAGGLSASQTFSLNVVNVNDVPVVSVALVDQATVQGATFSYVMPTSAFADIDVGDSLTYSIKLSDGSALPSWLSFDAVTRTLSGTPANGDVGSLSLLVTATDTGGLSASQALNLSVANVNDAPVVSAIAQTLQARELQPYSSVLPAGLFADIDVGDSLSYSVELADGAALPAWLHFDAATRMLSGTPPDASSVSLKIVATDTEGATAQQNFDLQVQALTIVTGTGSNDTLYALDTGGNVNAGDGYDTVYGGVGADKLYGGAGDDTISGGAGNDYIDGGDGYNSLYGGDGDDVIVGGDDTEVFMSGGEGNDVMYGRGGFDTMHGDEGNDTMYGGADGNIMSGGVGDDVMYGDESYDQLNGNEGDDKLYGGDLSDALNGGAGNDLLDGGAGNDAMQGGEGDDTYYVDDTNDYLVEEASEGTDTVISSQSWTLGANIENLALTGTAAINGTGNELSNVLVGNSGDNTLDGGAGVDQLIGGAGNDTYVVDDAADVATEYVGEGSDTVMSSVSYTLGANVEDLTLTGYNSVNGTGNELSNNLTGNFSDNILDGGQGADTMVGGYGDDTYYVDNAADVVTESEWAGTDTVVSSTDWTLDSNLENLTLSGNANLSGTGNTLANAITGNAGNNTLDGGAGADTLIGGTGNDTYKLGLGYGDDTIQESDATTGNTDVLQFLSGIAADQIWLRQVSNNLEVSVIGTSDKATLTNWYLGNQYHVEQFKTADGKVLLDTQVQNLVQAMAAFTPPAAGQTTLPTNYANSLETAIAANWQ